MWLLDKLLGGKKAPPPAPAPVRRAPQPVKQAVPRQAGAEQGKGKAEVIPLEPRPRAATPPTVYHQLADLPAYKSLASNSDGRFELQGQQRQQMAILELAEHDNAYAVVATRQLWGSASYKKACERITATGARLMKSGQADSGLISVLSQAAEADENAAASDPQIIRDIDNMVLTALREDASDIHLESRSSGAVLRMRINGRLQKKGDWPSAFATKLARALHTVADDDSKPQVFSKDAQMSVSRTLSTGQRVKLRVQVSSAYPDAGMDVVLRVLKVGQTAKIRSMAELGFEPDQIDMLHNMLSAPAGVIIICGTTGSGKSTSLLTFLSDIHADDPALKIITVEDPPEYVIPFGTQIPVPRLAETPETAGLKRNPFSQAMKAAMRMDPDVIMVGEIRDAESAQLAGGMTQSGHRVLTTIHASSPFGIVGRLRSMGIQPDVLGDREFIAGLIFQRLVAVLCPKCKVDMGSMQSRLAPELLDRIKRVSSPSDRIFFEREGGCGHCKGSGIVGRTVCAEMVQPDDEIRAFIAENRTNEAFRHWRSARGKNPAAPMIGCTALEHAIVKMRKGLVSPLDVERELGRLHDPVRDRRDAPLEDMMAEVA